MSKYIVTHKDEDWSFCGSWEEVKKFMKEKYPDGVTLPFVINIEKSSD